VFWKIGGSDPHEAISYDPLHADDGGFWGDHLFGQLKARVEELGRPAIVQIDAQYVIRRRIILSDRKLQGWQPFRAGGT